MLNTLRQGARTWAAKLLLFLLVISFAIWGISDFVGGFGQGTVVQVGEQEVDAREFQAAYQSEINSLQRQLNTGITPDMAQMFGIPQRVVAGLAANAAFDGIASELQLGISEERLVQWIGDRYAPSGVFDRAQMAILLQQNGMTEAEFVADERDAATRTQLLNGLSGGIQAPKVYMDAFYDFQNEQRVIKYLTVNATDVPEPGTPDEAAISSFFGENQSDYRAPEYRSLTVIELDPAGLAEEDLVSDDEVAAAYENSGDRFQTISRRQVSQLILPSYEAAQEAAEKLRGGASFEELVIEAGRTLTDVDLGSVRQTEILDPAIAEAAFALEANSTSGAINARFGGAIVAVGDVEDVVRTPLEDVAPALRQELAIARAEEDILDLYDEIEDARAGGASLTEIADRFGLSVVTTPPVSRAGADETGQMIVADIPGGQPVIDGAFESDIGLEPDPIEITRTQFAWFEVVEVIADRDQTLDEVRDQVTTDWRSAQIEAAVDAYAETVAAELRAGAQIADVAAQRTLVETTVPAFSRGEPPESLSDGARLAAFNGPRGHVAISTREDGRRIVMVVEQVLQPAFFGEAAGLGEIEEELEQGLENGLIDRFVVIEQERQGVLVNQQLIDQLLNPQDAPTNRQI